MNIVDLSSIPSIAVRSVQEEQGIVPWYVYTSYFSETLLTHTCAQRDGATHSLALTPRTNFELSVRPSGFHCRKRECAQILQHVLRMCAYRRV